MTATAAKMRVLPAAFYDRPTLQVAGDLLGKLLVYDGPQGRISGRIVETEAYIGEDDPACHAARGRTPRSEIMYGPPGIAYIYFIYGMYYCLNAVTEAADFPAAVLIRALEPLENEQRMQEHRKTGVRRHLTSGPGKLCQAFGLTTAHNGLNLCDSDLFIADAPPCPAAQVAVSARIGIRHGRERPWRFYVKDSRFVSRLPRH